MEASIISLILKASVGLVGSLILLILKNMHDKIIEQNKTIDHLACEIKDIKKNIYSVSDENILKTEKELAKLESKVNEKFLNHLKANDRRIDDMFKEIVKIPEINNQTAVNSTEIEWIKREIGK